MEISEHFRELRRRTLFCAAVFCLFAICAFYSSDSLWPFILRPLEKSEAVTIVNLSPAEGISANLLLAGLVSGLFSAPVALYHIYAFSAPAIHIGQRGFVAKALSVSVVLFYLGAAFAYFLAIPTLLSFLASFSSAAQMWSQTSYAAFFFRFVFLFAVAFLMPVAAAVFARTGLADRDFLKRHARLIVFSIVLLSAVLTPPDLLSLFWMAIPLTALYGASLCTYRSAWRER